MATTFDCSEQFALDAVSQCGLVYFWLPGKAKTFAVKMAAVKNNVDAMQFIFPNETAAVDTNYAAILKQALSNGMSLKSVPVAYRRLPSIVAAAVASNPMQLEHAVLDVADNGSNDDESDNMACFAYSDEFENDEFENEEDETRGTCEQRFGKSEIDKHNKLYQIVRKAVRKNGLALKHAQSFQYYRSIILAAFLQNPEAIQHCSSFGVRQLVQKTEKNSPGLLAQVARVVLGEVAPAALVQAY